MNNQKTLNGAFDVLADNVTEDIYQGYKTIFQDAFDTDKQLEKEIKAYFGNRARDEGKVMRAHRVNHE